MDRRRSPPRGEDRRYAGGGPPHGSERFRQRSRSPSHRYSPPPPSKRFRRDDDYQDDRGRRHGDRFSRDQNQPPMTFREFIAQLPNDITPDAAKVEFDRYLAGFYGNELRAEFEQQKNNPELRRLYDPRVIEQFVATRDAASQATAVKLISGQVPDAVACPPGPMIPDDGDYTDISGDENPKASQIAWVDSIVLADLSLSRQLVRALDKERGIEDNSLVPPTPVPTHAHPSTAVDAPGDAGKGAEEADRGKEMDGDAEKKKNDVGADDHDMDVDATTTTTTTTTAQTEEEQVRKEQEESEAAYDETLPVDQRLTLLDKILKYLWIVHGIDYYGGHDYSRPEEEESSKSAARLTVRPAKEDKAAIGTGGDSAGDGNEEKKDEEVLPDTATTTTAAEQNASSADAGTSPSASKQQPGTIPSSDRTLYEDKIHKTWRSRIQGGDPLLLRIQKERLEREVQAFIDDQVIEHGEKKWGNKISQKLFVAREFVIKHIRNKHPHVVEAQREKILDDIYFENYRAAKEKEGHAGTGGGGGGRDQRHHGGGRYSSSHHHHHYQHYGGRGRGRGRGRGMMGGMNAPMGMMMMGGPILLPGGGGPMAPVIMMPMGGGGGGRGGRGGGRGGSYGGGGGAPVIMTASGGRSYVDLDAPKNNRAVLDYGDL